MAASIITSTGAVVDAPGYGQGAHHFTDSAGTWWAFYYTSTSTTTLYAQYSADNGVTWQTPTNPTFSLTHANTGKGVHLGVTHKVIGGTDVVWLSLYYEPIGGTDYQDAIRARISGTTITWGTEERADDNTETTVAALAAPVALTSGNYVVGWDGSAALSDAGFFVPYFSTTPDTGGSTEPTLTASGSSSGYATTSLTVALLPLSSGDQVLLLNDNGTPNNVQWATISQPSPNPTATTVFGANVAMDPNDWGTCYRTDTDVHVVRRTGTSTYEHVRWNGTNFGAGQSIPSQTCKGGAGVTLVSDGTNVYLTIIDSDAANTIRQCVWNGTNWGAWTAVETSTQTRNYLTAFYSSVQTGIGYCWSQVNGSNYDLAFEFVGTGSGTPFTWQPLTDMSAAIPPDLFSRTEVVGY